MKQIKNQLDISTRNQDHATVHQNHILSIYCSFPGALSGFLSYFVDQADIVFGLINKFGYTRNTHSLLIYLVNISLNMNIVKVNLSNNGLSLTNITKYDISFQKTSSDKISENVAKGYITLTTKMFTEILFLYPLFF